jgi:hypothetical protein
MILMSFASCHGRTTNIIPNGRSFGYWPSGTTPCGSSVSIARQDGGLRDVPPDDLQQMTILSRVANPNQIRKLPHLPPHP